ncbi:hypothetical protein ABEB36_003097 [Hypothenemus hampei]|uniref:Uncharacterized protein n=1 Tax=Hypothenemus hampei TaxID=57062 RepID=A0ABD1FAM9_HYPHA
MDDCSVAPIGDRCYADLNIPLPNPIRLPIRQANAKEYGQISPNVMASFKMKNVPYVGRGRVHKSHIVKACPSDSEKGKNLQRSTQKKSYMASYTARTSLMDQKLIEIMKN